MTPVDAPIRNIPELLIAAHNPNVTLSRESLDDSFKVNESSRPL